MMVLRKRRPFVAGLMGPFGLGNLGDAAIQRSVIHHLRQRRPAATLYGISLNPADTEQRHGIPSFPLRAEVSDLAASTTAARLVQRAVREASFLITSYPAVRTLTHLIVSGGGQLDDMWGGPFEQPWALLKWSTLASAVGAKVIFLSVGAGPLDARASRHMVRLALKNGRYRSYRDEESRDFIARLGVREPGRVYPDLAFGLAPEFHPIASPRPTIAIGPLPFFDPRVWPERDQSVYDAYVDKLASVVGRLTRQGTRVLFVPGSLSQDPMVAADIRAVAASRYGAPGEAIADSAAQTVPELIDDLRRCTAIVTSRFHGLVLGAMAGRPLIALSYHPKLEVLMRNMGQERFCAALPSFTTDWLHTAIAEAVAQRESISSTLLAFAAAQRAMLEEQFDRLFPVPSAS